MLCRIAIPTHNRAHLINRAVRSALDQSHIELEVMVIDDASTDGTAEALSPFLADPRFVYVRLAQNVGTAAAKNVALVLGDFDAVTFHDSDDIAERDKLLRQAAILDLKGVFADPILNWTMAGRPAGSTIEISVALTQHWLLDANGGRRHIRRALSLIDDFFPQLQMNSGPLGDWILINPGLFSRAALARVGGFERCVEEDRELRNRLIMHGEVFWLIEEPLLTKVECADSLTAADATGYLSGLRGAHRNRVWERAQAWRAGGAPPVSPIDLGDVEVAHVSHPRVLRVAQDLPLIAAPRLPCL